MNSIPVPSHLVKIQIGDTTKTGESHEVEGRNWETWTIGFSKVVRKGFVEVCRRKLGPHEFKTDEDGNWRLHASDEDLAYVLLKFA